MEKENINISTQSSNKSKEIENIEKNNLENGNIDSIKIMNSKIEKKRKYGIDLLRIIAMFMVITVHIGSFSEFKKNNELLLKYKRYFLYFIWLWGLKCNVIFGLIAGYVGLNSKNKLSSILYLIFTTNIYSIIIEFITIKKNKIKYKFYQYIFIFFPFSRSIFWFYTCYVGLCYIKPYINLVINNISKGESSRICLLNFILFSCIITVFNTRAFAAFHSNSLFILSVNYYYGAHIKKNGIFLQQYSKLILMLISLFCHLLNVLLIYLNDLNTVKAKNKYYSFNGFINETNPLLLISSICDFIFFKDLNLFKCLEKIISIISPSVFFVYILGFNSYTSSFYRVYSLHTFDYFKTIWFLLYKNIYMASICLIIDYIRRLIFNLIKIYILIDKIAKKIEDLSKKIFKENDKNKYINI
jgi:surface polysaccharide O-acyltransferase-like enzyme